MVSRGACLSDLAACSCCVGWFCVFVHATDWIGLSVFSCHKPLLL